MWKKTVSNSMHTTLHYTAGNFTVIKFYRKLKTENCVLSSAMNSSVCAQEKLKIMKLFNFIKK